MERCVEYCNLRNIRKKGLDGTDTEKIGRIVQGSQLAETLNTFDHLVIYNA